MVSPAQVFAEAQAARDDLYVGTVEAAVLRTVSFGVEIEPTADALELAGAPDRANDLLGLYTGPPTSDRPYITLYAGPISRHGADPRFVITHEIGHALDTGADHTKVEAAHALVALGGASLECSGGQCDMSLASAARAWLDNLAAANKDAAAAQLDPWGKDCPVCLTYDNLVLADGYIGDTATETALQHRVPNGLGGTIPWARAYVAEAERLIPAVRSKLPDRAGQVNELAAAVGAARAALGGDGVVLNEDQVTRAARAVHRARQLAHQVTWAFFARGNPYVVETSW